MRGGARARWRSRRVRARRRAAAAGGSAARLAARAAHAMRRARRADAGDSRRCSSAARVARVVRACGSPSSTRPPLASRRAGRAVLDCARVAARLSPHGARSAAASSRSPPRASSSGGRAAGCGVRVVPDGRRSATSSASSRAQLAAGALVGGARGRLRGVPPHAAGAVMPFDMLHFSLHPFDPARLAVGDRPGHAARRAARRWRCWSSGWRCRRWVVAGDHRWMRALDSGALGGPGGAGARRRRCATGSGRRSCRPRSIVLRRDRRGLAAAPVSRARSSTRRRRRG